MCLVGGIAPWRRAVRGSGGGLARRGSRPPRSPPCTSRCSSAPPKSASGARLVAVGVETQRGLGRVSRGDVRRRRRVRRACRSCCTSRWRRITRGSSAPARACRTPTTRYGVMVRIDRAAVEAARRRSRCSIRCARRARRSSSGSTRRGSPSALDRKAMLFPLDNTCNWMVTEATHPGACTVSEAVLCAGDKAPEVIAWAFEEQDRIRSETKADPARRGADRQAAVPRARGVRRLAGRAVAAQQVAALDRREQHPRADAAAVRRQRQAVRRGRRPRPRVHAVEHARSPRARNARHGAAREATPPGKPAGPASDHHARRRSLVGLLAIPAALTGLWIRSADARLTEMSAAPGELAPVASASDVGVLQPRAQADPAPRADELRPGRRQRGARLPAGAGQERRDDVAAMTSTRCSSR